MRVSVAVFFCSTVSVEPFVAIAFVLASVGELWNVDRNVFYNIAFFLERDGMLAGVDAEFEKTVGTGGAKRAAFEVDAGIGERFALVVYDAANDIGNVSLDIEVERFRCAGIEDNSGFWSCIALRFDQEVAKIGRCIDHFHRDNRFVFYSRGRIQV